MIMTRPSFDMDAALKALHEDKDLTGKDGILTSLMKQFTAAAILAELNEHLANDSKPNRKNGSSSKKMKSPAGNLELKTHRDYAGSFEPQVVKKLTDELKRKAQALFALGNSYQDFRIYIADIYDVSLSKNTINTVTDKLLPEMQAWREHGLKAFYPIA